MNDSLKQRDSSFTPKDILSDMPAFNSDVVKSSVNEDDLTDLQEFFQFVLGEHKDKIEEISQQDVTISNIRVKVKNASEVRFELDNKLIHVQVDYVSGVIGENIYIVKSDDALRLAEFLSKQTNLNFSDFTLNILSSSFLSLVEDSNNQISSKVGRSIEVALPKIDVLDSASQIKFSDESQMIFVHFTLNSVDTAPITIYQLISISLAKELISLTKSLLQDKGSKPFVPSDIEKPLETLSSTVIRPITYQELDRVKPGDPLAKNNIALLLDISMQLTVELGRSKMQIRDILTLGEGSIIELDKLAGEPVDLLVNEKLVAKGEVVVIDENFGVRITEIVMPKERLEALLPE